MVYSPIRMTWSSECTNQTLLAGSRAPITGKKVRGPFRECQWPDLEGALRLIASRASTWGGIGLLRSDPASPNYGHWLSKEEVHASRHLILPIVSSSYTFCQVEKFVAPKPESTKAVLAWLKKANISPDRTSPAGDMLRVSVPVKQANSLFNANYTEFLSHETSTTLVCTLSYSMPADVDKHLSSIYPTNQCVLPRFRLTTSGL